MDVSVKDKLNSEIDSISDLNANEKDKLKQYLHHLPDGNTLCHFDFHPGNIIIRDKEAFIIDWMTACIGDPNADVARTYLLFRYGELQHVNYFVNKMILILKKRIGRIYISNYQNDKNISNYDFEQWLLPVAAGRLSEWITVHERKQLLAFVKKELSRLS